jgi:hypothetical protein
MHPCCVRQLISLPCAQTLRQHTVLAGGSQLPTHPSHYWVTCRARTILGAIQGSLCSEVEVPGPAAQSRCPVMYPKALALHGQEHPLIALMLRGKPTVAGSLRAPSRARSPAPSPPNRNPPTPSLTSRKHQHERQKDANLLHHGRKLESLLLRPGPLAVLPLCARACQNSNEIIAWHSQGSCSRNSRHRFSLRSRSDRSVGGGVDPGMGYTPEWDPYSCTVP